MDSKITLSFNKDIIDKAKEFANNNNISLSRLTEFLLAKATSKSYESIEDYPISDWVSNLAEGKAVYNTKRNNKGIKAEYFNSKK